MRAAFQFLNFTTNFFRDFILEIHQWFPFPITSIDCLSIVKSPAILC